MKSLVGVAIAGTAVAAVVVIATVYLIMNEGADEGENANQDMIGLYAEYEVTDNVLDYAYTGTYKATVIDANETYLLWKYEYDIMRYSLLMYESGIPVIIRRETFTEWVPIDDGGQAGTPGTETTISTPYFGDVKVIPYVNGKTTVYVGADDGAVYRMTTQISQYSVFDLMIFNLKATNIPPT